MKLGVTMPSRTAALPRIPEYAHMADEAGFDSVWTYELYRNPFAMLCASAVTNSRSELCTGLATAFNRSPFEAANAAADVDEWSGGRMKLGLGTPEECRQKLDLYKNLPHVALHTSYTPPFDAAESEDCYTQIIDTFKR